MSLIACKQEPALQSVGFSFLVVRSVRDPVADYFGEGEPLIGPIWGRVRPRISLTDMRGEWTYGQLRRIIRGRVAEVVHVFHNFMLAFQNNQQKKPRQRKRST